MGGGDVRFGGRIGFKGLTLGDFSVAASGTDMRVRYPEGFRSTTRRRPGVARHDDGPGARGTVTVKDAVWRGATGSGTGMLDLAALGAAAVTAPPAGRDRNVLSSPCASTSGVVAPSSLRGGDARARGLVGSAELTLAGRVRSAACCSAAWKWNGARCASKATGTT